MTPELQQHLTEMRVPVRIADTPETQEPAPEGPSKRGAVLAIRILHAAFPGDHDAYELAAMSEAALRAGDETERLIQARVEAELLTEGRGAEGDSPSALDAQLSALSEQLQKESQRLADWELRLIHREEEAEEAEATLQQRRLELVDWETALEEKLSAATARERLLSGQQNDWAERWNRWGAVAAIGLAVAACAWVYLYLR